MKTALRLLGLAALASSAVGALAAFNPASKPARVATTSKAATLVEKKQEAKVPALAPEPTKLQAKVPPGPPPPAPLEGDHNGTFAEGSIQLGWPQRSRL